MSKVSRYLGTLRIASLVLAAALPFILSGVASGQTAPPPTISTTSLNGGDVGSSYTAYLFASGGTQPYTWSIVSGALPAGLSLATSNPYGIISGTPTTVQTASFTVQVTDANNLSAQQSLSIQILPQLVITTPSSLGHTVIGNSYSKYLSATGGDLPSYYWSFYPPNEASVPPPPPGLLLNYSTGELTWTPTTTGSYTFTVWVSDNFNGVASETFTLDVTNPAAQISQITPSSAVLNTELPFKLTVAGSNFCSSSQVVFNGVPLTTTYVSSSQFAGQLLEASVPATAFPTSRQEVQVYVSQANSPVPCNPDPSNTVLFTVDPPFLVSSPANLPDGSTGVPYAYTLSTTGGVPGNTWSVTSGALPPGLTLSADGNLAGTPTTGGTFTFGVHVYDGGGHATDKTLTLKINTSLTISTVSPLPGGSMGVPYSQTFTAANGVRPYQWSIPAGTVPPGLSLSGDTLSGTPSTDGAYNFTVKVTDGTGAVAQKDFQLVVGEILTITTPSNLPPGKEGVAYQEMLSAQGGTSPYQWTLTSGSLPGGLTFAADGTISGTPNAIQSSTFTVQVKDQAGNVASKSLTLTINSSLTIQTPPVLPSHPVNVAVNQSLVAEGGTPPYAWTMVNGSLPNGLTFGADGTITGTATAAGMFNFTAEVTDSIGSKQQRQFELSIGLPPAPNAQLSGVQATITAGSQPTAHLELSQPYPLPITVNATLSFQPLSGSSQGTTDLRFADSNSPNATFTIPANTTGLDMPFQSGTISGTVTLGVQLQVSDQVLDVTVTSLVTQIGASAPTIGSVRLVQTATGFNVVIDGYSPTRDVSKVTFTFNPAPGANLQTTQLTLDVSALFSQWYQNPASSQLGSQFEYTQPFNVQGATSQISSVGVSLTNSQGTSQVTTATF